MILGCGKTRDSYGPVMVVTNISWLSGSHHGHSSHGFYPCSKHSCLDMLRSKYWAKMRQVDRTLFYLASSDLEYWQNNYGKVQKFARMAKVKAVDKSQNGSFSIVETSRFHGRNHTLSHNRQWFEISESEIENADVSSSEADSNWLTAILNWSYLLSRNDLTYLTFQSTMFAGKWIFLLRAQEEVAT